MVDIVVTGRKTDVPVRFRAHAEEKLGKVEKLASKVIRVEVRLSRERNKRMSEISERVELTCISRGPVIRAEAAAADMIAAFDLAWGKLEARLRRVADRRRVHRGSRTPVSVAAATAAAAPADSTSALAPSSALSGGARLAGETPTEDERAAEVAAGEVVAGHDDEGGPDGPLIVREKLHIAAPMTLDQALYEMELVGHDFFLFCDEDSGLPSVVYRRRGYDYGVIRIAAAASDAARASEGGGASAGAPGPAFGDGEPHEQEMARRAALDHEAALEQHAVSGAPPRGG